MVGVTIGVGPYEEVARYAAKAVEQMTGLRTIILGQREFLMASLPSPHFLKLKVFDLVGEDAILFFDADMVPLNKWNPKRLAELDGLVAVGERPHPMVVDICEKWHIPINEYFNSGMMLLKRREHDAWLKETVALIRSGISCDLYDQTPLNITRYKRGLPLRLIDRRYNWIGFGDGPLSFEVPVFMAHGIDSRSKERNLKFFQNRGELPLRVCYEIDDEGMADMGESFMSLDTGGQTVTIYLARDGRIWPSDLPLGLAYWFVSKVAHETQLVVTSEFDARFLFKLQPDGRTWTCVQQMQPASQQIKIVSERVQSTRWFTLQLGGYSARRVELMPCGLVGHGASSGLRFWYVKMRDSEPTLVLGSRGTERCHLRCYSNEGVWRGELLTHDRVSAVLIPEGGFYGMSSTT